MGRPNNIVRIYAHVWPEVRRPQGPDLQMFWKHNFVMPGRRTPASTFGAAPDVGFESSSKYEYHLAFLSLHLR